MPHEAVTLLQRNYRVLRYKVTADGVPLAQGGVPYDLAANNGSEVIWMLKAKDTDDDFDAKIVKRTVGLPQGGDDQVIAVAIPPPAGGSAIKWAVDVFVLPKDVPTDLAPGLYYFQIDILPIDRAKRFTAHSGDIEVVPTGILTEGD